MYLISQIVMFFFQVLERVVLLFNGFFWIITIRIPLPTLKNLFILFTIQSWLSYEPGTPWSVSNCQYSYATQTIIINFYQKLLISTVFSFMTFDFKVLNSWIYFPLIFIINVYPIIFLIKFYSLCLKQLSRPWRCYIQYQQKSIYLWSSKFI